MGDVGDIVPSQLLHALCFRDVCQQAYCADLVGLLRGQRGNFSQKRAPGGIDQRNLAALPAFKGLAERVQQWGDVLAV